MGIRTIEGKEVWIVGQVRAIHAPVPDFPCSQQVWEFAGVFASWEAAEKACRDRTYFVAGPFEIGKPLPHETTEEPLNWFPLEGQEGDPIPGELEFTIP